MAGLPWAGAGQKKNPGSRNRSGIALFIRRNVLNRVRCRPRSRLQTTIQAGLLTPGSPYWLRLPDLLVSDNGAAFVPGHSGGPVPDLHGVPSCVLANTWTVEHRTDAIRVVKRYYFCRHRIIILEQECYQRTASLHPIEFTSFFIHPEQRKQPHKVGTSIDGGFFCRQQTS